LRQLFASIRRKSVWEWRPTFGKHSLSIATVVT
jgi:hypothetical protein